MSSTVPPVSKTSVPAMDGSSQATTSGIMRSPARSQSVTATDISDALLTNLRAHAESGDADGVANYLDCGTLLTLLNAYSERNDLRTQNEQLGKDRSSATVPRERVVEMLTSLLKS